MIFPVIFITFSTNPIILPKQILLGGIVIILLVLQALKMLTERSVKLRRTYFDIPVLLLALFAFISSVLAVNRADSLTAFVPYLFAILAFFLIVNIAKDKNSMLFSLFSLVIGAILLSLSAILSFFKIYILPFSETRVQTFTPLGSLLEQEIYLILIFAISFYYLLRLIKSRTNKQGLDVSNPESLSKPGMSREHLTRAVSFGIASIVVLMGIIVTTYSIFTLEKPILLPIETGFQTAFSEISLDSGRIVQGFLVGSGFGTYAVDFSRWKQPTFNQNQDLWNLTFFRSSNFILELLATTGVLGICAFIFLLIRVIKEIRVSFQNKMTLSLLALFVISCLLPLGFATQTLFFIILGLFAANQGLISKAGAKFFDIELQLVAFKKGLIAMETPHTKNDKSLILPLMITVLILFMAGVMGYFSTTYVIADINFQKSLISTSQNNGSLTYQLQTQAISIFPYRDGLYRVFSQTNLALANALASQQSKESPDPTVQQNITTLIQQSINAARSATTISPQTSLNWQNLSSIYRALIGFGQNAESFAIATAQQSISLNPNNPSEYINLGGIYYQLGQWDNAQNQFQIAITLKPDLANAHYNLGHALEQKGDLQNALAQYQMVKTLVSNDKLSLEKINKEIEILEGKAQDESALQNTNQTLNVNTPETQLPPRTPPVQIQAPPIATESSR